MNHIKILGDISLKSLLKLHIITEVNNHGKATFSGIIAEETGKEILENKIKKVTICYDFAIDNKSYSIVLFAGQIKKCRLKITGRIYNVEVECFSSSIELDKEKKSRSFQNIEMTYGQLFLQMSEEENIILAVKDSNKKIPYPLIQYEETDWKFLKRIAGYLKTMIVPDISQMSPRIAIGTIQGKSYEIFDIDIYQITKNIQYQEKKQNYFYEIKGEINWNLCDKIYYNGEQLMIVKKEIELLNGTLQCKIRAGKENSMAINIYHNNCLCGLHLLGQVIEVDGERLKLNLDIDNKNKGNEMRHSYPYLPITGNGMYAMPEVGSIVRLYFPNDNEKDAFVIDCFSANKNNEAVPDLRRMIIADKNELRLFFSELNIETDSNQIELVDVEELSMSSKGKICINARENILIRNR